MTTIKELIKDLKTIKQKEGKTLQDLLFFDGVVAIIESKYIEKEKEQIISAFNQGYREGEIQEYNSENDVSQFDDGENYYNKLNQKQ
jgi:N-acetyl-anhydromuramyl-L-alanine amidase AmpD